MNRSPAQDIFDIGLRVQSHEDLLRRFRDVNIDVGPPHNRTKKERERHCLVNFLLLAPPNLLPQFPLEIKRYNTERDSEPSRMDFEIAGQGGAHFGVEISEATDEDLKRIDAVVSKHCPGKVWESSQLDKGGLRNEKDAEQILRITAPAPSKEYTPDSQEAIEELEELLKRCVDENRNKLEAEANRGFCQKWLICYPHTTEDTLIEDRPLEDRLIDALRTAWWSHGPMYDLVAVLFDHTVVIATQRQVNRYPQEE